jgi:hypothetical protein
LRRGQWTRHHCAVCSQRLSRQGPNCASSISHSTTRLCSSSNRNRFRGTTSFAAMLTILVRTFQLVVTPRCTGDTWGPVDCSWPTQIVCISGDQAQKKFESPTLPTRMHAGFPQELLTFSEKYGDERVSK